MCEKIKCFDCLNYQTESCSGKKDVHPCLCLDGDDLESIKQSHNYVWTVSKYKFSAVRIKDNTRSEIKRVPIGEPWDITIDDEDDMFDGDCTIEKAQRFMDLDFAGLIVLKVVENN